MQAVNWYNVITWGIIHSLWQGALITLLCWLILLSTRKVSANFRYIISCLGLFSILGLFVYQVVQRYFTIRRIEQVAETVQQRYSEVQVAFTNISTNQLESWLSGLAQYSGIITALYTAGLIFLVFRLGHSYYLLRRIRQSAHTAPDNLVQLLDQYAQEWNISRPMQLSVSSRVTAPATWGWLRPLIVLPTAAINQLSVAQMEAVLLHELAHIRRHDYFVNVLQSVTETVLFFNPFALWLSRQIRTEREHCCDEWVSVQTDPVQYAESLLSVAMLQNNMPSTAIGLFTNKHQLLTRIKRITTMNTQHPAYLRKIAAALVAAGIIVSIAWIAPQDSTSKKQKSVTVIRNDKVISTGTSSQKELEEAMKELEIALRQHDIDGEAIAADVQVTVDNVSEIVQSLPLEEITTLALNSASTALDAVEIINWDGLENMVTKMAPNPEEAAKAREDIRKARIEAAQAMKEARVEVAQAMKEARVEIRKSMKMSKADMAQARVDIAQAKIDIERAKADIEQAKADAKIAREDIDWSEIKRDIADAKREVADAMREVQAAVAEPPAPPVPPVSTVPPRTPTAPVAPVPPRAPNVTNLAKELEKDGLITDSKKLKIKINNGDITVNGKPIPDNLKAKYDRILQVK